MKKSNFNLRADAEKSPIFYIIITLLLAIGLVSIPLDMFFALFISDKRASFLLAQSTLRLIFSCVAVFVIFKLKFNKIFKSFSLTGFLISIPIIIVAINNFPIIGISIGDVFLNPNNDWLTYFSYILYCLSIGIFEELVFRGIIFPMCLILLKNNKYQTFWAIVVSSLIFGLVHLVNLINSSVGATFLQVGYSFLMGGAMAICLVLSKNILIAILIHLIYDVGGLIFSGISGQKGIAIGNQWGTATIVITAVLGSVVFVIYLILATKLKNRDARQLFDMTEEKKIEENGNCY